MADDHQLAVIRLLLLGCGGVGRQLLQHIVATRALHAAQGLRVHVVAVIDSRFVVAGRSSELEDSDILYLCSTKAAKASLSSTGTFTVQPVNDDPRSSVNAAVRDIIKSTGSALVVADCTASEGIGKTLGDISDTNCCIVLANKKPLTSSLELYEKIVALHRRFRYFDFPVFRLLQNRLQVGAGLPVIAPLNRIINSGDPIKRIVGALSGTLGFLMSELQEGKLFSAIVKSAKALGYTEPDPRDDLSGMDVARKALIMARLMGWRLNLEDVKVDCLYPMELGPEKMTIEKFLEEGLPALDLSMKVRVEAAGSRGCVLRYVATIENLHCKVGLVEQPRESALGQLRGSDNLIEIHTRCYHASPLVIKGAGAGNDTTAAGVLADILDLQEFFT